MMTINYDIVLDSNFPAIFEYLMFMFGFKSIPVEASGHWRFHSRDISTLAAAQNHHRYPIQTRGNSRLLLTLKTFPCYDLVAPLKTIQKI